VDDVDDVDALELAVERAPALRYNESFPRKLNGLHDGFGKQRGVYLKKMEASAFTRASVAPYKDGLRSFIGR
jgi:hypothetical protein